MREARAQVTHRIDGIAGRSAEGEADPPNQAPNKIRTEPGGDPIPRDGSRKDRAHDEHQDERSNDFSDEVSREIPDAWNRAETGEFRCWVGRFTPVWEGMDSHDDRAQEGDEHLCYDKGQEIRKVAGTNRKTHRHNGIKVCTGAPTSDGIDYTAHHCKRPSSGDDHPAEILCLGFIQEDGGYYAITEQDQDKSAQKFAQEW
jgi:hypothetical protein